MWGSVFTENEGNTRVTSMLIYLRNAHTLSTQNRVIFVPNMVTTQSSQNNVAPQIIDIRQNGGGLAPLVPQIRSGLNAKDGEEKKLPTLLLYDEDGLKLFEKITYLEEYYPTGQEIEVLEAYADRIADRIALEPNSMLVELGSGQVAWLSYDCLFVDL